MERMRQLAPWMIRLAAVVAIAVTGMSLVGGCNTTKGAGQDVENLGRNVKDAAEDAKP